MSGQTIITPKELGDLLEVLEGWLKVVRQAINKLPPDTQIVIAAGTLPGRLIKGASDPEIKC